MSRAIASMVMVAACGGAAPVTTKAAREPAIAATPVAHIAAGPASCPPGEQRWCKSFAAGRSDVMRAVAFRPGGGLVVVGAFESPIDFGGGERVSRGKLDGFVVGLAEDGSYLWDYEFGGPGAELPCDVAVGADGSVYVTGGFVEQVDFGGGLRTAAGGADAFVVALAPDGSYRWDWTIGGPGYDYGRGVDVRDDGLIAVAGHYGDGTVFQRSRDTRYLNAEGNSNVDAFVVAIDDRGSQRWSWTLESSGWASFGGLAFSHDSIIAVGRVEGDTSAVGKHDDMDALFVALDPDGELSWARTSRLPGSDVGLDALAGQGGEVITLSQGSSGRETYVRGFDAHGATASNEDVDMWLFLGAVSSTGRTYLGNDGEVGEAFIDSSRVPLRPVWQSLEGAQAQAIAARTVIAIAGFIDHERSRDLFVLTVDQPNPDAALELGPDNPDHDGP